MQLSQLLAIGTNNGEDAFLPRIPLLPSDANLHFDLKQLQYLVKVSFAMYLNHASPRFRSMLRSCAHVQVACCCCLPLQHAPMDAGAWSPSSSATYAGGVFPSSTGAHTVCKYCNLHCVVVVVVYIYIYISVTRSHKTESRYENNIGAACGSP